MNPSTMSPYSLGEVAALATAEPRDPTTSSCCLGAWCFHPVGLLPEGAEVSVDNCGAHVCNGDASIFDAYIGQGGCLCMFPGTGHRMLSPV